MLWGYNKRYIRIECYFSATRYNFYTAQHLTKIFYKSIYFSAKSIITPIEKRLNIKIQTKGEKENNREEKRDEQNLVKEAAYRYKIWKQRESVRIKIKNEGEIERKNK